LGEARSSPQLLTAIRALAVRTSALLDQSRVFASQIRDRRLALEVSVIQRLAEDLVRRLMRADPLSERVHHRKHEALWLALGTIARFSIGWRSPKRIPEIAGERP